MLLIHWNNLVFRIFEKSGKDVLLMKMKISVQYSGIYPLEVGPSEEVGTS